MLISSRNKPISQSFRPIDKLNTSEDQSKVQSTGTKRFARTKNIPIQNSRRQKHSRCQSNNKSIDLTQHRDSSTKKSILSNSFIKAQDLLLTIANTPIKKPGYMVPLSTDRATQSTCFRERHDSQAMLFSANKVASGQNSRQIDELRAELELKINETMILDDQNIKLKRDLLMKEQQYLKSTIKKQKQHQIQIAKLQDQQKSLRSQLKSKNEQMKEIKKHQSTLTRQIKALKYDKVILQKQIQQLYKRKLPREMKELMSYREISLMKQIQELKEQIQHEKTDVEVKMEKQIRKLKEENILKNGQCKNLQIHSHILTRKINDNQSELKVKIDNLERSYENVKENNYLLIEQIKNARKQNLKLRRLHILSQSQTRKSTGLLKSPSEESLSLSIESN